MPPNIAVGNVPDDPGWVRGVPPLAVEYADVGQDEADLQSKIRALDRDRLTALAEALAGFSEQQDLNAWLADHA